MRLPLIVCMTALASGMAMAASHTQPHYAITARIRGPLGVTGWDYATIDSRSRRLLLATYRAGGGDVTVLDLRTGRTASILQADATPHGFASLGGGVAAVADAAKHAVLLFEESTGKVMASVDTGKPPQREGWHNPDSLLLEPRTKLLIAVNGDSGSLALVDTARRALVGSIEIGGDLEAPAAGGDGIVYVNVASKSAIAVVDVPARKVVRELALKSCEDPTGLAYDAGARLLISVCGNGVAKFVDPGNGAEVASIPVAKGADGVMYDPGRKVAFFAGGDDGKLSIVSVRDRRHIFSVETLPTAQGVRLGAVDPVTGDLYLPTAKPDLAAPPLRLPGLPPIPPAASGTFQFLVVTRR